MKNVNVNPETGIHYGVCCPNRFPIEQSEWFDDFTPVYFDENGNEITDWPDDGSLDNLETETYICDKPDLKAEYNSNTNIIMVFYSKKVVLCALCSPCYPNAGDLDTRDEEGVLTYSLF
jgi:hypothetical protein